MFRSFSRNHRLRFGNCPSNWLAAARRPNIARFQSTAQTAGEDDQDLLEIIRPFGTYIPVLSENPLASGTEHILRKTVPPHILCPPYARPNYRANRPPPYRGDGLIKLGTEDEPKARRAGALAAMTLNHAHSLVKGSHPRRSTIGYMTLLCPTAHTLPPSTIRPMKALIPKVLVLARELENGDILNIDITVYLDGFHGDTSDTFLVGDVDPQGQYLTNLAGRALHAGISVCRPGAHFRYIGRTIHDLVRHAEEESGRPYVVSPQFTGHGIGRDFHRPPWIIHTVNEEPGVMQPGHCFTIEPAIIQGTDPSGWMLPDGWTILSESYGRSAQAEHTILITETGVDILTDRQTAMATFEKYKP